jgi:hypothetical protein
MSAPINSSPTFISASGFVAATPGTQSSGNGSGWRLNGVTLSFDPRRRPVTIVLGGDVQVLGDTLSDQHVLLRAVAERQGHQLATCKQSPWSDATLVAEMGQLSSLETMWWSGAGMRSSDVSGRAFGTVGAHTFDDTGATATVNSFVVAGTLPVCQGPIVA